MAQTKTYEDWRQQFPESAADEDRFTEAMKQAVRAADAGAEQTVQALGFLIAVLHVPGPERDEAAAIRRLADEVRARVQALTGALELG